MSTLEQLPQSILGSGGILTMRLILFQSNSTAGMLSNLDARATLSCAAASGRCSVRPEHCLTDRTGKCCSFLQMPSQSLFALKNTSQQKQAEWQVCKEDLDSDVRECKYEQSAVSVFSQLLTCFFPVSVVSSGVSEGM